MNASHRICFGKRGLSKDEMRSMLTDGFQSGFLTLLTFSTLKVYQKRIEKKGMKMFSRPKNRIHLQPL
jgi:hypothetical protein